MLVDLFPRFHARYLSLPLFGSCLEGFGAWLAGRGYPPDVIRRHFRTTGRIDGLLRSDGVQAFSEISREALRFRWPQDSQDDVDLASSLRLWEGYLEAHGDLPALGPPTESQVLVSRYSDSLRSVRGLAISTVKHHALTAAQFLEHLGYDRDTSRLSGLDSTDIEGFVRITGQRLTRASMQHTVAHLRSFLRFLALAGKVTPGLDSQIDTPRVYRGEQLPRAIAWETVCSFLKAIDRSTPMGLRDYAIFLLIASYGLRANEIVALKLDDLQWRKAQIFVPLRKGAAPLVLPLTDLVGGALIEYLRGARPTSTLRQVFLRCRAPAGVLKPTAVTEAFQGWVRRSGLPIPFHGPHCLRHSYAVHLLRQGVSLKTIGDLLGHKNAESTCAYIRLAVEDLRGVALPLPLGCRAGQEVKP
jgi:integrase/recombinase XerD